MNIYFVKFISTLYFFIIVLHKYIQVDPIASFIAVCNDINLDFFVQHNDIKFMVMVTMKITSESIKIRQTIIILLTRRVSSLQPMSSSIDVEQKLCQIVGIKTVKSVTTVTMVTTALSCDCRGTDATHNCHIWVLSLISKLLIYITQI